MFQVFIAAGNGRPQLRHAEACNSQSLKAASASYGLKKELLTNLKQIKKMETNQNLVPELYSAQFTTSEPISESESALESRKLEQITQHLRELLDPDYILLFGSLAGGTPHSMANTYDLLVSVDQSNRYTWYDARRYLRMKMPKFERNTGYVNIYVITKHLVEANVTPFIYLSRREGRILYQKYGQKFIRPHCKFDFGQAAVAAERYMIPFLSVADELIGYAARAEKPHNSRLAAIATAYAAIHYYRTLYFVYHGFEADTSDIRILQQRMRTLSGEFMLLFESDEITPAYTLPALKRFLQKAQYDPEFIVDTDRLNTHIEKVTRFGKIVSKLCVQRIELYKSRSGQ